MAKRKYKKKSAGNTDYFYQGIKWVLIACAAFLIYEQSGKLISHYTQKNNSESQHVADPPKKEKPAQKEILTQKDNGNDLESISSEKIQGFLPKDVIDQGIKTYKIQTKTDQRILLTYAKGDHLRNPDLGQPEIQIIRPQGKGIVVDKSLDFSILEKQIGERFLGTPEISREPVLDQSGNQFFLVKTLISGDILKSVSVLKIGKNQAWTKIKNLKKQSYPAVFLEGESALGISKITLSTQNGSPQILQKEGTLDLKSNTYRWTKKNYLWNGSYFERKP